MDDDRLIELTEDLHPELRPQLVIMSCRDWKK